MSNEKEIYSNEDFNIYDNNVIKEGNNGIVFVTGSIISDVLEAAKELSNENINLTVINVCTIKPLNEKSILNLINKFSKVFVVEEHNVIGGLGSSISDIIATNDINCNMIYR